MSRENTVTCASMLLKSSTFAHPDVGPSWSAGSHWQARQLVLFDGRHNVDERRRGIPRTCPRSKLRSVLHTHTPPRHPQKSFPLLGANPANNPSASVLRFHAVPMNLFRQTLFLPHVCVPGRAVTEVQCEHLDHDAQCAWKWPPISPTTSSVGYCGYLHTEKI